MRRLVASSIAFALALSSCGAGLPWAGGDLDVIVLPDADGTFPAQLMVNCPHGPEFPFGALEAMIPLDEAPPEVQDAVTSFLIGEEGQYWPQTGWKVLTGGASRQLLVSGGTGSVAFLEVRRSGGEWRWSGGSSSGGCPLEPAFPRRLNPVEWRLDPAAPSLDASSVEVVVLATEVTCVSGMPIGDRLVTPQVVMTEDSVRIALAARPPPGTAFNCPGNPESRFRIALPEPLGSRSVVEGIGIGVNLEDYLDD